MIDTPHSLCTMQTPSDDRRDKLAKLRLVVQVKQQLEIPNWVVLICSLLCLGGGLFGISYGILSASWDPMRDGSKLGFTEFKANLPLIIDRVRERGGKGRV